MADDVRERHRKLFGLGDNTERVVFFSDAVFAIAMTLLVLDIRLPEVADESNILPELLALWPQYFAYVLSFLIIALNWFGHHRKFRVIERFDARLLWINMLLLLLIAFVPFPTSLLSDFDPQSSTVVLYAATVGSISLVQAWLWIHAYRAGLMSAEVDDEMNRYVRRGLWPVGAVFFASIPIALVAPVWAMYFWVLMWPLSQILDRVGVSRRAPRRNPDSASAEEH
ncbi:TMEM175 family protein [soil metagenome]